MVRAAVIQSGPGIDGDPAATNEANFALIRKAASEGAELIQLAELSTTPYFASLLDVPFEHMAETLEGEVISEYRQLCAELGTYLVLPFFEREGDAGYFNSACLIDGSGNLVPGRTPDGHERLTFRKVHLPASYDEVTGDIRSDEKRCFTPGDDTLIFDTPIGKIGMLICWDKRFTELWREYMLRGAEIVCNPICTWGAWRDETYPLEVRVMALYNQFFVLGGSKSGVDPYNPDRIYSGGSHIAGPDGELLASLGATEEGIVVADIDVSRVHDARRTTPILRDRRPEAYGLLTERTLPSSVDQPSA